MYLKSWFYIFFKFYKYSTKKTKVYNNVKPQKTRLRILLDLLLWFVREGTFNDMYFAFGINHSPSSQNSFLSRRYLLKHKLAIEKALSRHLTSYNYDSSLLTKDKFILNNYLKASGIPVVNNEGLVIDGIVYLSNGRQITLSAFLFEVSRIVFKSPLLEAGEGVFFVHRVTKEFQVNGAVRSLDWLIFNFGKSLWALQVPVYSHLAFHSFNSTALNTTRIVTILSKNVPVYLTGFQSFATGNAMIDSWSKGSIYVGIDPIKFSLKGFGLTSLQDIRSGWLERHPDTNVPFAGFSVPFLKESIELCIRAHRFLYYNFLIGWDVAITQNGPLILEANEKPGMNVAQCLDGGLKEKFTAHSNYTINYLKNKQL